MTRDEVLAKLAELPDTADGIAAFLAERGVKGYRHSHRSCPIANYLDAVSVSAFGLTWKEPALTVDIPRPALLFVRHFDNGEYPELIA